MLRHLLPSSYLQGTSCKCWEKTVKPWVENMAIYCKKNKTRLCDIKHHRMVALEPTISLGSCHLCWCEEKCGRIWDWAQRLSSPTMCYTWANEMMLSASKTCWQCDCSLTFSPGTLVCMRCFLQRCRQLRECHSPSSDVHSITNTDRDIAFNVNMKCAWRVITMSKTIMTDF